MKPGVLDLFVELARDLVSVSFLYFHLYAHVKPDVLDLFVELACDLVSVYSC